MSFYTFSFSWIRRERGEMDYAGFIYVICGSLVSFTFNSIHSPDEQAILAFSNVGLWLVLILVQFYDLIFGSYLPQGRPVKNISQRRCYLIMDRFYTPLLTPLKNLGDSFKRALKRKKKSQWLKTWLQVVLCVWLLMVDLDW